MQPCLNQTKRTFSLLLAWPAFRSDSSQLSFVHLDACRRLLLGLVERRLLALRGGNRLLGPAERHRDVGGCSLLARVVSAQPAADFFLRAERSRG
jgi:hypothetical protein